MCVDFFVFPVDGDHAVAGSALIVVDVIPYFLAPVVFFVINGISVLIEIAPFLGIGNVGGRGTFVFAAGGHIGYAEPPQPGLGDSGFLAVEVVVVSVDAA